MSPPIKIRISKNEKIPFVNVSYNKAYLTTEITSTQVGHFQSAKMIIVIIIPIMYVASLVRYLFKKR